MSRVAVLQVLLGMMLLGLALPLHAQPELSRRTGVTMADTGVPGYRFSTITLASQDGARRYRLRVAIPERPAPKAGYPVAWMLDGNAALMDLDPAFVAKLARTPRAPVLVFVSHDNDLRIDGDARAYDYTPSRGGAGPQPDAAMPGRRNGGADALLTLLQQKALPELEAVAAVDRARQGLWGHSYGGVFVLHTLFTRPQAFAAYGAADPSLWWGDGYLLKDDAALSAATVPSARLRVWAGTAPRETPGIAARTRTAAGKAAATTPARDMPATHGGRDDRATQARRDAMQRARGAVPADAAAQLVKRLQAHGIEASFQPLAGLTHGQTLGASLPLFLRWFGEQP